MKAMVLKRPRPVSAEPLELKEIQVPRVGPGDILIRVKVCGVCHTDLHTVEGDLCNVRLPRIPGHEVIGVVERTGKKAGRFKTGQRVGAAWLFSACGTCRFCTSGRENLCAQARFSGYDVNGGYAEYMVVPEKFAYAIPKGFSDEKAAPLMCAGIIGYRALRRTGIKPGDKLGLFGFGASAHIVLQVAKHWGCRVYVFSRSADHRKLAIKLGARWTGTAKDRPPSRLDGAIIFAPVGDLYLDALRAVDRGGAVVSAGIYMSPIPELDYGKFLYHERTISSVANATREDGEKLLKLAVEIPIRTTVQLYPLEQANGVLRLLKAGRINGAAVLKI